MVKTATKKNNVQIMGNKESEKTLVFGHGFGTDNTSWRFVLPAFENEYKIITYDNVGAGKSDMDAYNSVKYSHLNSYAQDLVEICDELDVEDAVFIGHSVSGMVGLLASKIAPDFFKKHVFMNASPRYLNDGLYKGGFDQSDLDSLYEAMATNYYAWVSGFSTLAMRNEDKPSLAAEFARTLSEVRPDVALAVAKAIFESDHRKDLPDFEKESLFIQSKNDIAVPMEVAHYFRKNISNSTVYEIDVDGHFPHISAPEEIVTAIRSFI